MKKYLVGLLAATTLGGGTTALFAADARANPYTDKGTHYELPIASDIPQGERVEIAKDRAAMTLKGWNDEYAITIEPQIPTAALGAVGDRPFTVPAKRPLLSKRMEYKSGNTTAFIEPVASTSNEFDIDFTLDTKPNTNVFTYKITGAEDFDFFYQPALTQEEIDEGAERPDNVVGSYAVYSKTKANHRVGSTNYATGKVAHIYRPKAIDANGNEAWATLEYSNGVLSVMVPQEFLDSAVYPVMVDPTIGNTSIGGTENSAGANFASIASRVTASEDGTVTMISVYARDDSGTSNFKGVIWGNEAFPAVITNGIAGPTLVNSSTAQWWDITYGTSPSLVSGNSYRIGSIPESAARRFYDSTGSSAGFDSNSYASPAALDGLLSTSQTHSVYATYTASGGSTINTQSDLVIFE